MRVIMRSTAHRYPRGRFARAERRGAEWSGREAWSAREGERGRARRGRVVSETGQKEKQESGREKEEDEVARRRQRTREGQGGGARKGRGGVARGYTPYDGVGMRESALGRLRLEWRVWYVTMRAR